MAQVKNNSHVVLQKKKKHRLVEDVVSPVVKLVVNPVVVNLAAENPAAESLAASLVVQKNAKINILLNNNLNLLLFNTQTLFF